MSSTAEYLLDTSAYSAFMRGHREVVAAVLSARLVVLSPIVLGELHQGFLRGSKRLENLAELEDFLAAPSVQTTEVDSGTAEVYASIYDELRRRGAMIPINDVWIAATALQRVLTVLTTDRHFARIARLGTEIHPV